ncbi:MAG: efflux RND transporter periplasmic adaptor subunit [Phycisphaerales bacterium]|nr:efflux RND transporter periplasmic adaptor subunit [Phycisphaerales bacterium]
MWQHMVWRGLLGLVFVAVLLAATVYLTRKNHAPEARQADGGAHAIAVKVQVLKPRDIPIVRQYLAQTEASEIVQLRARVSGFLIERGFEDGDTVEQGQVLFRIDPQPFEVALRRAEAGLKAAEAQLVRADQQVLRFQELAELQQAAANELEQAQEAQRIAVALVETQRALIEQARLDLDYATVRSPISGVIGARFQDVGNYVGPGADALLATVRKVDPLYARYSVSERDSLRWQRMTEEGLLNTTNIEDLSVEIVLPDGQEFPHRGHIDYVDVAVDPSTGTTVIRSVVPNPDHALRPGQFVHVRLLGIVRKGALVVPQSAVLQTPNGAAVYVVDDAGKAQMRPVVLDDWADKDWIVSSGLAEGERVIVDHLVQIRPGASVEPSVE